MTERATIVSRERSFEFGAGARMWVRGDGKSDDSISREELRLLRASARTKWGQGEFEGDSKREDVDLTHPKMVILLETSLKNGLARASILGNFWGPYGGPMGFSLEMVISLKTSF